MRTSLCALFALAEIAVAVSRLPVTPISELRSKVAAVSKRDVDPSELYPARYMAMPIDHFHNESQYAPHSSGTFMNRYWFDDTYYKPGGPVYVLQSGETDATGRLEFLQHGILYKLSMATGGLGVVMEHRYYGTSNPTSDLSVENLRFLTTDQALADMAYFAKNVVFEGHEHQNLTSHTTPYIAYGGSYAGAMVAILRKLYPDVYWGAISSSGVTEAIYDYWRYYEPVAQYGPKKCVAATQQIINAFDNLFKAPKKNAQYIEDIRNLFSLNGLSNKDVLNTLTYGIAGLQSTNWVPSEDDTSFYQYCGNLSTNSVINPSTNKYKSTVQKVLTAGGYGRSLHELTNPFLNWISWNNRNVVEACTEGGSTISDCYNTQNATFYAQDGLDTSEWRSWPWQYCNQWGFLQTGSGVPKDRLPVISRQIDLEYTSTICRDAFNITTPSDTQAINKYGGYDISYPRLAIIGGELDPWRPSTPLANEAPRRRSTTSEPAIIIKDAVHHWDEYGVFDNQTTRSFPPKPIKQVQQEEVSFVKAWLKEYKECH